MKATNITIKRHRAIHKRRPSLSIFEAHPIRARDTRQTATTWVTALFGRMKWEAESTRLKSWFPNRTFGPGQMSSGGTSPKSRS